MERNLNARAAADRLEFAAGAARELLSTVRGQAARLFDEPPAGDAGRAVELVDAAVGAALAMLGQMEHDARAVWCAMTEGEVAS